MKNEINAVIKFISFVQRTKNLGVSDPAMNASLSNARDVLQVVQEGNLKKVNNARNMKTVRNCQEGLPFTINDVREQYQNANLLKRVCTAYHVLLE
jgi:hypothetical protein